MKAAAHRAKKSAAGDAPCYCIRARRAANALTRLYDGEMGASGLTVSQFSLLCDVRRLGPCSKSELAQQTGLDRTTVIRNLSVLLRAGLVTQVPGADRRGELVQLTPLGESALRKGAAGWKQAQARVREAMGPEELEKLLGLLAELEALAK